MSQCDHHCVLGVCWCLAAVLAAARLSRTSTSATPRSLPCRGHRRDHLLHTTAHPSTGTSAHHCNTTPTTTNNNNTAAAAAVIVVVVVTRSLEQGRCGGRVQIQRTRRGGAARGWAGHTAHCATCVAYNPAILNTNIQSTLYATIL